MFSVTLLTASYTGYAYSRDIPTVEEGNMKKLSTYQLTARINRFMDRKRAEMIDVPELSDRKARRSHYQHNDVSAAPYIALAIR